MATTKKGSHRPSSKKSSKKQVVPYVIFKPPKPKPPKPRPSKKTSKK